MLRDLLKPELNLVVCGTAASTRSAKLGHYYAGPGNKFWRMLHELGVTPRQLEPSEWPTLTTFGVGLTDAVKDQAGMDRHIDFGRSQPTTLRAKVLQFQPRVLCFNGKRAAQTILGPDIAYGPLPKRIGQTELFVAPSTSGAANAFWNLSLWEQAIGRAWSPTA